MNQFFENQSFWKVLSDSEKSLFLDNLMTSRIPKNGCMISESEECPGLIWVKQGRLRASVSDEKGTDITLFRMQQNELCVLSASCVLKGIHFDMMLSAIEDTEVYILPKNVVKKLVTDNLSFYIEIQNEVLERFSDVIYLLTNILGKRMNIRLAEELLDLCDENNEIKITHEELALYLNSAREVISRTLKYLEQENYIKVQRGTVYIKDKQGLINLLS